MLAVIDDTCKRRAGVTSYFLAVVNLKKYSALYRSHYSTYEYDRTIEHITFFEELVSSPEKLKIVMMVPSQQWCNVNHSSKWPNR